MPAPLLPSFPTLLQPEKGFRYGIDSFLLARFAHLNAEDEVCDLGAGVGILSLLALSRRQVKKAIAIEIQTECAQLAKENAKILGVEARLEVYAADWRTAPEFLKAHSFEVVLSNPPYRPIGSGKSPPENSKALAKHEIAGGMQDLFAAADYLLKSQGRFYVMYPPLRLEELARKAQDFGFKMQRLAFIHPYIDRPATLLMTELVRSSRRELHLEAPIIIYQDENHYTPEVEAWVGKKQRKTN